MTLCDDRGPRPTDKSKEDDLHNTTEYMDYGELDIAGTLMDIFEHQQFSSNISIEPGDKIRVLSNIVKIELDDVKNDHIPVATIPNLKNQTSCTRKIVFVPSSTWLMILNIVSFILGFSTFLSSLILIFKFENFCRRDLYIKTAQTYHPEHVSLTSSCE